MREFSRGMDDGCEMASVEAVACLLGVSTRTLQRVCQEELGLSPVAARRRLLATRAVEMLNGGHRLSAVSSALGFANSGHLTRLLESLGLRPSARTGSH
jgi:transcriptional regulator GlxA family with amidase domain